MPLIKMGAAARRARMGSTNTIRRALIAAGVPLVTLTPGVFAVEEHDLNRFLSNSLEEAATDTVSKTRPKKPAKYVPVVTSGVKPKSNKRRP